MNQENLRKIRTKHGLSQKQTAEQLGMSHQRYNQYETGRREPDNQTLTSIATLFNVSADYLLGITDDPAPLELVIPDVLKDVQVAFHRGEFEELTQDEVDALAVLAQTLKEQRKKKEQE